MLTVSRKSYHPTDTLSCKSFNRSIRKHEFNFCFPNSVTPYICKVFPLQSLQQPYTIKIT